MDGYYSYQTLLDEISKPENDERYKVLSKEEEFEIRNSKVLTDDEKKEALVCHNLRFVVNRIKKDEERSMDLDDQFQLGVKGLIDAVEKFDMDSDVRFLSFAGVYIFGRMKRAFEYSVREFDGTCNYSVISLNQNVENYDSMADFLHKKLANNLKEKRNTSITDLLDDERFMVIRGLIEESVEHSNLSDRQKEIIRLYYFENLKDYEIADVLESSQQAINKLRSKALNKMNNHLVKGLKLKSISEI